MKIRALSKEQGAVMMETVLTLPLYLILLAGVFYLGDFCLARLALNHGERARLWESGNRHSSAVIAAGDIFYFLNSSSSGANNSETMADLQSFSAVSSFPSVHSGNRWGQVRDGQAKLNLKRSVWSFGVNSGALNVMAVDNPSVAGSSVDVMQSRSDSSDVQLYSRTNDTSRVGIYNSGFSRDSGQWLTIYQETWPSVSPSGGNSGDLSSYTRNSTYRSWSI